LEHLLSPLDPRSSRHHSSSHHGRLSQKSSLGRNGACELALTFDLLEGNLGVQNLDTSISICRMDTTSWKENRTLYKWVMRPWKNLETWIEVGLYGQALMVVQSTWPRIRFRFALRIMLLLLQQEVPEHLLSD
jgi:hypothetical protein